LTFPAPRTITVWSERWTAPEDRLTATGRELQSLRAPVTFSAGYERWDVECRGGLFASARARLAVEEHSARRQLVRVRLWPRYSLLGLATLLVITGLTASAAVSGALIAAVVLGATATLLVARALFEASSAMASILHAARASQAGVPS
jgi:hypothetical protein